MANSPLFERDEFERPELQVELIRRSSLGAQVAAAALLVGLVGATVLSATMGNARETGPPDAVSWAEPSATSSADVGGGIVAGPNLASSPGPAHPGDPTDAIAVDPLSVTADLTPVVSGYLFAPDQNDPLAVAVDLTPVVSAAIAAHVADNSSGAGSGR